MISIKERLIKFGQDHMFESIADVKADLTNEFPGHKVKVEFTDKYCLLTVDEESVSINNEKCDDNDPLIKEIVRKIAEDRSMRAVYGL